MLDFLNKFGGALCAISLYQILLSYKTTMPTVSELKSSGVFGLIVGAIIIIVTVIAGNTNVRSN